MPIYERPTWALMENCLEDMPQTFTSSDVVSWFGQRYPRLDDRTVRQHLRGIAVNDGTKRHMRSIPRKNLVYKSARGTFEKYIPAEHGQFDEYGRPIFEHEADDDLEPDSYEDLDSQELTEQQLSFALEAHLEDFIETNLSQIRFGSRQLRLFESSNGYKGRQFSTEIGPIDLLCKDVNSSDLVVIELKKGRHSDRAIGQCLRYMGWVEKNLAQTGQAVKGIVIAHSEDPNLRYAASQVPSIEIYCFEVSFALRRSV
jgi:endonuclease